MRSLIRTMWLGKLGIIWVRESLIVFEIIGTNPPKTSNFKVGTGRAFLENLDALMYLVDSLLCNAKRSFCAYKERAAVQSKCFLGKMLEGRVMKQLLGTHALTGKKGPNTAACATCIDGCRRR